MKKFLKTFIFVFAIIFVVLLSNVIVKADTGPKPYVSIKIIGDTQGYYMTLISRSNQCGPYSNNPDHQDIDNIDLKFASYNDSDGYYYLYYYSDISNNVYGWNYYPPSHFKILIYDSINDRFITNNEKYERTSFETAFTIELVEDNANMTFTVKQDHYYLFRVIMGVIIRFIICLTIELGIAFLFKIKNKQLLIVLAANVLTQLFLNITLGIFINNNGLNMWGIIPIYVFSEILIVIIEAVIYCLLINKVDKDNQHKKLDLIVYAIFANIASIVLGFVLLTSLGF